MFVQTEKVIKIGCLPGSSTAQHRIGVQRQLEEAIWQETGQYIQLKIQKKNKRFKNQSGQDDATPILHVETGVKNKKIGEANLKKILQSGNQFLLGAGSVLLHRQTKQQAAQQPTTD